MESRSLMRIAAFVLAIIYGLSAMAGGISGITKKTVETWSAAIMALSGVLLIVGAILFITRQHHDFRLMLLGLIGIALTALRNGFQVHGKPTLSHHFARLLIALAIVLMVLKVGT
jgi:CHASE2 domain-containing sensor protein